MNTILLAKAFSSQAVSSMIVTALICVAVPFIILAFCKTKFGGKISTFFVGACIYLAISILVVGGINALLFNGFGLSQVLTKDNHPVYFALYGVILAGILEELGKYLVLKHLCGKRPGKENALLYGLGHGALETITYGSSLFMGNVIIALMVNSLGLDEYLGKLNLSETEMANHKELIYQLMDIPAVENVICGSIMLITLLLQTALTILVYTAIHEEGKKNLLFVAMGLHVVGYLPNYLSQVGVIQNDILVLSLTAAITILVAAWAMRLFRELKQ